MKRNMPTQDRFGPITIERVERDIEFMAYVVKKYGDVYAPILTRLRAELNEMQRHQPSVGKRTPRTAHLIPDQSEIADDTPLRLETAARLAFPDGALSANALRNAISRGDIEHERLGGRIITTLRWIREWRERHRHPARSRTEAIISNRHSEEYRTAALASAYRATAALRRKDNTKT